MRYTSTVFLLLLFANFSIAQQAPYHPLRINNNITLDGKLSEPEWQQAEKETDFMQYDPTAGVEPSEKTEIKILYNDSYLFVGLRAFDHHPDKLVRYSLQRDFEIGNDDGFAFVLDMYNDKSSGLVFINNILNARYDSEISQDGVNENESYNTFWDVASSIDSTGYTSEFQIPFSSLRYQSKDTVRMGFLVVRLIKRINEIDLYPRCDPHIQDAYFKVSLGREMEFYKLKSRKPFYVTPYVIANYSDESILNSTGTAYENHSAFLTQKNFFKNKVLDKTLSNIGGDIKYGLSKNLTMDVTLNTDFAQAEEDNLIVNLTKYEVNLPEKRSFFLESQNYLSYSTSTSNELFISRSIGLEANAVVPIIAGIRVTGKTHGWQMGMLDMQTKNLDDPQIPAHNIFVLRTRKDIDASGSYAGGIITNHINTTGNDSSAQTFGLDILKKLNQQVTASFSVAGTTSGASFKNINQQMDWNAAITRTARQGWYYSADVDRIGKNFTPVLGYVQENDLLQSRADLGYKWQATEESKKANYYLHLNLRYKWKPGLKLEETKYSSIQSGVSFKSGATIDLTPVEYQSDRVLEDWHLTDHITIPTGVYKMLSPEIKMNTPQKSKYRGTLFVKFLDFYGGKRITVSPTLTYVFNKYLTTTIEHEFDRIKFPVVFSDNGSALFISNLTRLTLSYYLSTRFSIKLLSQYDELSKIVSTNLRFRFNPREGTDLFIVFNQDLNNDRTRLIPHLPLVSQEAVIVKFLKTFSF
jgi:Domain of unknown function (DUF1083).